MLLYVFLIFHKSALPHHPHTDIRSYTFIVSLIPISNIDTRQFQPVCRLVKLAFEDSSFTRTHEIGKVTGRMKVNIHPYPVSTHRKHCFHFFCCHIIAFDSGIRFLSKIDVTRLWMNSCRNNPFITGKKRMSFLKSFATQKHSDNNRRITIGIITHK